ncbi:MAG: hypothetical protein WC707_02345 [Candidatus Babeliaceae bacterium]|jgi:hypothetical protein
MKKLVLLTALLTISFYNACMENTNNSYICYKTELMRIAVQNTTTTRNYLAHGTLTLDDVDKDNKNLLDLALQYRNNKLSEILSNYNMVTQETKDIRNRLLHEAAQDVNRLKECIAHETINFDSVDLNNDNLLHLAVQYKKIEIINYMKRNVPTQEFERIKAQVNNQGMTARDLIITDSSKEQL